MHKSSMHKRTVSIHEDFKDLLTDSRIRNIAKLALWVYDNHKEVQQHFNMSQFNSAQWVASCDGQTGYMSPIALPPKLEKLEGCGTTCCFAGWAPTAGISGVGYHSWTDYILKNFTGMSPASTTPPDPVFDMLFEANWPSSSLFAVWRAQILLQGALASPNDSSEIESGFFDPGFDVDESIQKEWDAFGSLCVGYFGEWGDIEVDKLQTFFYPYIRRDFLEDVVEGRYKLAEQNSTMSEVDYQTDLCLRMTTHAAFDDKHGDMTCGEVRERLLVFFSPETVQAAEKLARAGWIPPRVDLDFYTSSAVEPKPNASTV